MEFAIQVLTSENRDWITCSCICSCTQVLKWLCKKRSHWKWLIVWVSGTWAQFFLMKVRPKETAKLPETLIKAVTDPSTLLWESNKDKTEGQGGSVTIWAAITLEIATHTEKMLKLSWDCMKDEKVLYNYRGFCINILCIFLTFCLYSVPISTPRWTRIFFKSTSLLTWQKVNTKGKK